jgi:hypothetical protein
MQEMSHSSDIVIELMKFLLNLNKENLNEKLKIKIPLIDIF